MAVATVHLVALTAEALSVPLVDPFVIASGRVDATRSVLVRATVREGEVEGYGLGEASCLPPVTREDQGDALQAVSSASPSLCGQSFADWDALHRLLDEAFVGFPVARSGVEMAILDAIARARDMPLFELLAGTSVSPAPIETDITLPILAPERMAGLAEQWWAKGFRAFKVKVGRSLSDDLEAMRSIAKRIGPRELRFRVDANCGYEAADALAFLRESAAMNLHIECIEQPCAEDDFDGLAEVVRSSSVPVIADESVKVLSDLARIRAIAPVHGVNLKVAKSGSLLRAYDIGLAAKAAGMQLMVGGMVETRLGMTAATHLVAALGGVEYPDLDTAWLLATDPFSGGYREDGPIYTLGADPGLGIALRPASP